MNPIMHFNPLASGTRDRQMIRVCAPTAHEGIGNALRRAFVMPSSHSMDREMLLLLEEV